MTKAPPKKPYTLIPPPGPARARVLWRLIQEQAKEFYRAMLAPLTVEALMEESGIRGLPQEYYEAHLAIPFSKIARYINDAPLLKSRLGVLLKELEQATVANVVDCAEAIVVSCAGVIIAANKRTADPEHLSKHLRPVYGEHTDTMVRCALATVKLESACLSKVCALHTAGYPLAVAIKKAHEPTPAPESATVLRLPTRNERTRGAKTKTPRGPR